jgi:hypothetical protein
MKIPCKLLLGLMLLPVSVFAQVQAQPQSQPPGPEIQVVDGKVSMNVQAVPLGRIVSLVDRAMGLQSKVAPELASRNISVRFNNLPLKDAVQKIFEGQPLNYMLIEGKGINVTGMAQGGSTATPTTSSFDSVQQSPINQPPPLPNVAPIQPANPVPVNPATGQPAVTNAPFPATGNPATANPAATTAAPGGAVQPGQMPPPLGANPLPIMSQPPVGPPVQPGPPPPGPQQPAAPGTLGATPGAVVTPGTVR